MTRAPEVRERVHAFVLSRIQSGYPPTLAEVGEEFGFSAVAAWKHVNALVRAGRLARGLRGRRLIIPDAVQIETMPTETLVAELNRRERQDIAA